MSVSNPTGKALAAQYGIEWNGMESAPFPATKESNAMSDPILFALPDGRVKEGYTRWEDDFDSPDQEALKIEFLLANDSCNCCHYPLENYEKPIAWAKMPKHS